MTTEGPHPLRKWRISQGLTVAQAAEKASITRQTWHAYEAGRRPPLPSVLARLMTLTAGAVTPNDFYPDALSQAA